MPEKRTHTEENERGKEWWMREGKGKTRTSEKKGKWPGSTWRIVPNMEAGGSHPQTMSRVPEETLDETEEEEQREEKKEDDGRDGKK